MASRSSHKTKTADGNRRVPTETLHDIVAGFHPERIGLAPAWGEFYTACQAGSARHELLQAIHDIKESIEDAEGAEGIVA